MSRDQRALAPSQPVDKSVHSPVTNQSVGIAVRGEGTVFRGAGRQVGWPPRFTQSSMSL
ncbi:conserved protein of unknown function [Pseudomonas marincola]|uniref:Uncharacterized protein n=1 Tax=Pseudomonas marincola TaxID=437900 RepID=A0A653E2S4_9PSED|nr:conserved protein of unknown function [Pseudomonas marincola]